ncbi:pyridoxamine 5'-phosphate oxidase [Actinotalea sp.]|uniref:pyridoxamine 5'-phosphate oxidase n=1 Tax=Actinotalea sp. TaxID=1872145 RepID=UPI002CDCC97E|nr:pyridoxamine 5'-phosphate oxidase [Actinotalea sp.]HQY33676.1 pyridoxamine 5'-phosphate oxidase [Actinotalea sp.]HRA50698.1 pyridoxamine 5'-phosphate oxidase [Actinotalea sp.]
MSTPEVRPDAPGLDAWRRTYLLGSLDEVDVDPDPFVQVRRWFDDAVAARLTEPNAMVLATASADAVPSARTVLLKGLDERGFVLFSHHGSRKGRDMAANPRASLVFPWFAMDRQVVVVGDVELVDRAEVEAYFASRPHGSRLGAWVSRQSTVIADRSVLDERLAEVSARWPEGTDVPVPAFWGGFRVVPSTVELWQGRESRLHDRLRYRRAGGGWVLERLSP